MAALAATHAARVGRDGARPDGDGSGLGGGCQGLDRAVRAQRPGARRGQPAHAPALGDRRAEGEVPPPAVRGHGPLVLRDDRARGRRLRPDADQDVRLPRRRRVGGQRPQVVHLRCARCSVRAARGAHRGEPRDPAGRQLVLHRRPAVRRMDGGARHRHDGGRAQPLRDPDRGPARAGRQHARRTRPGTSARSVPARAGAARPLHALDRPGGNGARHDGGALARALTATARSSPRSRGSSG